MATPKQPWLRKSTGTWHVWVNNKQVYLGRDKKEAHAKFHRLMDRGKLPSSYTVRQIIVAYWDWAKDHLAPSTCDRRKPLLETFSEAVPAKLKGEELKPLHVQRWLDANKRIKSPTTEGNRIGLIKGVFNWAKRMGYIERNPIVDMPRPAARVRQDFVPVDAWPKLLALATDQEFVDFMAVMLSTGCRVTEITRFEALHFDGSRFVLPILESKGRKRSRVVYLPPDALAIVRRLVEQNPEGKLFLNSRGEPWTKNAVKCRFKRLKRELKMPTLCATTLRHSYAHWRLTQGQDSLTVAKLLGHVDTRMVSTRYGHLEAATDFMAQAASAIAFPLLPSMPVAPTA